KALQAEGEAYAHALPGARATQDVVEQFGGGIDEPAPECPQDGHAQQDVGVAAAQEGDDDQGDAEQARGGDGLAEGMKSDRESVQTFQHQRGMWTTSMSQVMPWETSVEVEPNSSSQPWRPWPAMMIRSAPMVLASSRISRPGWPSRLCRRCSGMSTLAPSSSRDLRAWREASACRPSMSMLLTSTA